MAELQCEPLVLQVVLIDWLAVVQLAEAELAILGPVELVRRNAVGQAALLTERVVRRARLAALLVEQLA